METECLLDAAELSQRLGVGKSTVYRMSSRGLIPSIPVGASLTGRRFCLRSVREALAQLPTTKRPYHGLSAQRQGTQ